MSNSHIGVIPDELTMFFVVIVFIILFLSYEKKQGQQVPVMCTSSSNLLSVLEQNMNKQNTYIGK